MVSGSSKIIVPVFFRFLPCLHIHLSKPGQVPSSFAHNKNYPMREEEGVALRDRVKKRSEKEEEKMAPDPSENAPNFPVNRERKGKREPMLIRRQPQLADYLSQTDWPATVTRNQLHYSSTVSLACSNTIANWSRYSLLLSNHSVL